MYFKTFSFKAKLFLLFLKNKILTQGREKGRKGAGAVGRKRRESEKHQCEKH